MPDTIKDPYAILKLPPGSSIDDVRKQYHRLARIYHPDRNPNDQEWCEEQLIQLNDAYDRLSIPAKKAAIDRALAAGTEAKPVEANEAPEKVKRPEPVRRSEPEPPVAQVTPDWWGKSEGYQSDAGANVQSEPPLTGVHQGASQLTPASSHSRNAVIAFAAACAVSFGVIACIMPRHQEPKGATTTAAKTTPHQPPPPAAPLKSAQEVKHPVKTANRPHVKQTEIVARHDRPVTPRVAIRSTRHEIPPKQITKTAAAPHKKTVAPPVLHGDQATAVALRLAEQAEARGRATYARKLKSRGISPNGMNYSQMRRAADRSQ